MSEEQKAAETPQLVEAEAKPESFDVVIPNATDGSEYADAFTSLEEPVEKKPEAQETVEKKVDAPAQAEAEEAEADMIPRAQYEELLAKYEASLGGAPAPQEATKPESEQPPVTTSATTEFPRFEISSELADKIGLIEAGPLSEALTGYVGNAIQQVQKGIKEQVRNLLDEGFERMYVAQQFFDNNEEARKYPKIMRDSMIEVIRDNPGISPREAVKKLEEKLALSFGKAKKIAKSVDLTKPGSPDKGTGKPQVRKDGAPTQPQVDKTMQSIFDAYAVDGPISFM